MLYLKTGYVQKYFLMVLSCLIFVGCKPLVSAAEKPVIIAAPILDQSKPKTKGALQTAVLAGGCFWGVQAVFEHVRGVHSVVSGYAGGEKSNAFYEAVSSGKTKHAEAVSITFDPSEVSYGTLLHIFFSVAHNPTQLNRQGPDTGTQYRSAIFYADDEQKNIAQAYIVQLNKSHAFSSNIVTRLDPLQNFYAAEGYHQDFLIRHPTNSYIVVNDLPKIENLKKIFSAIYRDQPVRWNAASY